MISLQSYLAGMSSSLSRKIECFDASDQNENSKSIRFSDITNEQSFSLSLEHNWASTIVKFRPDLFAADVIDFLSAQAFTMKLELENVVKKYENKYSLLEFMINNRNFKEFELVEFGNQFHFEVEVLTPRSSIGEMKINDQEKDIVSLALEIFSCLLPEPQFLYSSAEEAVGFPEGAVSKILVNRYERDPRNRMAAIRIHGTRCMACDFDFSQKYGPLGQDFIVIHHLTPVSQLGKNYVVDPEHDLNPLCANCHAMVHRFNPPLLPSELRKIIELG